MKGEDNISSIINDITKDVCFKCLFGNKGNEKITKCFIENIIKKQIMDITLDWKLEMEREKINDKLMIADVIAKDKENKKYIIEMQKKGYHNILKRFVGYTNKVHISDIKIAEFYEKLSKTTLIAIVEKNMKGLPSNRSFHTVIQYKTERNELLQEETQELHILELDKYKKTMGKQNGNPWLEFIINPYSEEVKIMARTIEELRAAVEKYNELCSDEEVVRIADAELFARLDRNEELLEAVQRGEKRGKKRGEKQGKMNEKMNIARKMLLNKLDIEDIIKYTGLTKEQIKRIKITA